MHLDIDQINIRLKGVSPETARQVAEGLGLEIQRRLDGQSVRPASSLDAGAVKTRANPGVGEIRRSLATRIAGSINAAKGGQA